MRPGIARVVAGLVLALLLPSGAAAQSADSILKKHFQAVGGEKALRRISTARIAGSVRDAGGSERAFVWQMKRPDRFYAELEDRAESVKEGYNGTTGWRVDNSGAHTLSAREQSRARATALYRNAGLLDYKKEKSKLRLAGRGDAEGRPAFILELTTRNGILRRIWVDAQSYLVVREEFPSEVAGEEVRFADYRRVNGVLEPFRIVLLRGGVRREIEVRDVAHNLPLDNRLFDFPALSGPPLPDILALLRQVEKNQKRLEEIRENYTYNLAQTEYEVDDRGGVRTRRNVEYEVFYFGNWTVQRLVKKDGRPLTPAEEKKEDERIEKIARKYEEYRKKEPERKARDEKKKQEAQRKRRVKNDSTDASADEDQDEITLSDFFRISRLVNPRRERFRGRDVIVFEFEPRADYKARNRGESLMQKLAGAMWIDEQAHEIARLEARMLDNFRIGGGFLASLQKGSALIFEQELVNNEVWLPSYAEINASARVLLVKGFRINALQRYSNYRKFRVETRTSVVEPPQQPQP